MSVSRLWFERHPRRTLAGFVGICVVLCLVAAEVALRILTPGPPFPTQGERALRLREHPPSLDITRSPPESRIAGSDGLSDRAVHFATDSDGFILPSRAHASPDRTVLFLGGSTTEC